MNMVLGSDILSSGKGVIEFLEHHYLVKSKMGKPSLAVTYMDLSGIPLKSTVLGFLTSNFSNIQILELANTHIDDEVIANLEKMNTLTELNLNQNSSVTCVGI